MQKINNIEITPFKSKKNNKKILHKDIINIPFWTCFLSGKKGSGKTSTLGTLLMNTSIPKYTIIRIFSTTTGQDETMKEILKKFDKYKQEYEIYENLYDEEGNNLFEKQFKEIQNEIIELNPKLEKSKVLYPLYIYVIDDMSHILRDKALEKFIFRHRHLRTCFILSSQYYNHISPPIRANINFLILFGDISLEKLKLIYSEKINSKKFNFDDFIELYDQITSQKYQFMYINCDELEIRKNLNYKIDL